MEIRNIEKSYDGVPAIVDFSIDIADDEYLTLLGPSGSGKSTLLRIIAGLEQPDSGAITLNGEPITGRPPHLRGLGFVQQNYALFPLMSVFDNVAFGLRHRLLDSVSDESEVKKRTNRMLELVGLEELGDRMVGEISGGQKQRVSLARTLVTEPRLCLLDEPLGALDANLRERMTAELRRIRSTLGVTFMHVTGNEIEAFAMGDRMIVLEQGTAVQIDEPAHIFSQPATVGVARHVNNYNVVAGFVVDAQFDYCGNLFQLSAPPSDAHFYVVRFDKINISPVGEPLPEGSVGFDTEFIASEFMGSNVVYFFARPDGGVFEVDRHLSREEPSDYRKGQPLNLNWSQENVLLYNADGQLLSSNGAGRAL